MNTSLVANVQEETCIPSPHFIQKQLHESRCMSQKRGHQNAPKQKNKRITFALAEPCS